MSTSLQRAGVAEVSNRTATLEALQVTAQQMADTRYTQQNFFFEMAGWPGDCVKTRGLTIKAAVDARPTPLDASNQPEWFTKVFDMCQSNLPASTPLQKVDVMWASLPAEQACLWFAEVREIKWAEARNPEMMLEALITQFLGGHLYGWDAHRNVLSFNLKQGESLIQGCQVLHADGRHTPSAAQPDKVQPTGYGLHPELAVV